MAQRRTLTVEQVAILRWVGDGCPEGVMEGTHHRISAGALRNRGLLTTSGRGRSWSAKTTRAGREYLQQVNGPEPPVPRQGNASVTQQLLDEVIAAGGVLRVPRRGWADPDRIDYEHRVQLAVRHRKVPAGKRLTISSVEDGLEIRLLDAPDLAAASRLVPVVVPQRIARYHPAARAFRDHPEHHQVSRALLPRATRLVHAIASEAERRGWQADAPQGGAVQITARDHELSVLVEEEGVHARAAWEDEVKRYRHISDDDPWYRRPLPRGAYDTAATGRLRVALSFDQSWIFRGRQSRWADRQSIAVEELLAHLFREIEERLVEADHDAQQRQIAAEKAAEAERRAAEERERQWHKLMEQAQRRLVEAGRAAHLRKQSDAWHEAQRLRRYCDALDTAHGHRPETQEWLTWARDYADRLDPLAEPPTIPAPPEATAEALQEHLPDGWSAQGPEYGHRPRSRLGWR